MNYSYKSSLLLASCLAFMGGSLWESSSQSAQAAGEDRVRFKDYRRENAGLDRHMARRMFQIEKRAAAGAGLRALPNPDTFTVQCGADGIIRCGTDTPKTNNHESRVRNQSLQLSNSGLVRLQSGVDLDLTSQSQNIVLGEKLFDGIGSVKITVGGESKTVSAGSQVTAAEYVAVKQVLSGGNQNVIVNAQGVASGGNVDLGALTDGNDVMKATGLVVAPKVTTYGDFGKHSDFRLTGDLTNYGSVRLESSDAGVRGGAVRADDITNHKGASISSSVDLTLEAAGQLNNFGVIASDQGLTLSAGDSVSNTGSIKASGDINLNSVALNNNGVVRSNNGNINLNGVADAALSVNNVGGVISANNGAINLRDAGYSGASNSTLYGGDLLSKELNMHSGNGVAVVRVEKLTGLVNETGFEAHVMASTEELNIGSICLTGDPTIYNSQGSINITSSLSVAENLAIIASGNVTTSPGVVVSANSPSQGFEINIFAGADFKPDGGKDAPTVPPIDPDTPGEVLVTGKASNTGGAIVLGAGSTISTRPTGGSGSGGKIYMAAFGKAGIIDLSEGTVLTGGQGTGNNGSVTLIAGAKSGDTIFTGTMNLRGGTGTDGGSLLMSTAQPKTFQDDPITFDEDGTRVGSEILAGKPTKANIVFIDSNIGLDVDSKFISAVAGGDITVIGDVSAISGSSGFPNAIFSAGLNIAPLSDTAGTVTADSVLFTAGKNIGKVIDPTAPIPLPVTTNNITANAKGQFLALAVPGTGALNLTEVKVGGRAIINAPQRSINSVGTLSGPDFELTVFDTSINVPIQNFSSFTLNTVNPAFILGAVGGSAISVGTLTLFSAGGIGTQNNFFIANGVGVIQATTTSGDIFLGQANANLTTYDIFSTNGNVEIISSGDVNVRGMAAPAGKINLTDNKVGGGTVIFRNATTARDSISVLFNGDNPKNKITFAADSTMETTAAPGLGAIDITLGNGGGTPTPQDPSNLVINESGGGTVNFLGSGVYAKKPDNTLTAKGANLNFLNSFKPKNLTLAGNVRITADPPVEPGAEVLTRTGPTRVPVLRTIASNFAAGGMMPAQASQPLEAPTVPMFDIGTVQGTTINLLTASQLTFVSTDGERRIDPLTERENAVEE